MMSTEFEIEGFSLVGGGLCPEQYDVLKDGKQVGYLRLRHGTFRVTYPDVGGEILYVSYPEGDGAFNSDERDFYLCEAVKAIRRRLEKP